MNGYIYLFCDRLILWKDYSPFYKVVRGVRDLKWYSVSLTAPLPIDTMIRQENYGYNMRDGFVVLDGDAPPVWNERAFVLKKIQVLEQFNRLANAQKLNYTDNSIGQPLADVLLVDEIRLYQATRKLDDCPIITSYLETTEAAFSPDALVAKLWLKYQSYAQLVANLNRLEFKIHGMLDAHDFDGASGLIKAELEKIRM